MKIVTLHIFTDVKVKMLLKEFYKGRFAHGHQLKIVAESLTYLDITEAIPMVLSLNFVTVNGNALFIGI